MRKNLVKTTVEKKIGANTLSFETGWLAKQADAAVVVRYGDTVVINAVTSGPPRAGIDFFPLTCDYRERTSAAGKFPGGFIKREGRPTQKETLTSRLIDRPIRPMFPAGFVNEVQCQAMVVSSDKQNDGDVLAMNGVSTALFISPIPFEGPVASVRIGRIDGEWVAFPTNDDLELSDIDMVVSGTEQAVTMIEGFARELPEDDMLAAIEQAHVWIREICQMQRELASKLEVHKMEFEPL
ncbi:MAG TPA: polyribonucleotide nucleotidyltransferase, partial [Planctomycetaceae bacterium]|nr:polyribonucleotide nucleotidyltransferase [Planctomycetaceae bacterium]